MSEFLAVEGRSIFLSIEVSFSAVDISRLSLYLTERYLGSWVLRIDFIVLRSLFAKL